MFVDFLLFGIVEFIIYGCTRYFRERYQAAAVLLNDPGVIFCKRVTNYMKEKIEKTQYHRVVSMDTKDQRFEVSCKDRAGCPQTKGRSGLLDNAGRQGFLQMQEATASSLTMLPSHCGMFRIWVGSWRFCFRILQKRNRCAHLGPWDIWHRQSGIIHYTKYLSNVHSQSRC